MRAMAYRLICAGTFGVAGFLGEHGLQLRLLEHVQATQADLRDVLHHPKRGVLEDVLGFCEVDDVAVGHAPLAQAGDLADLRQQELLARERPTACGRLDGHAPQRGRAGSRFGSHVRM